MAYCSECRKETTTKIIDTGYGTTEMHGTVDVDINNVKVTECCESEIFFEDEQDFIDSLRYDLGKELQDRDDLSNAVVLAIESLMRSAKPQPSPSPEVHRGDTIINLVDLVRDICMAPYRGTVK